MYAERILIRGIVQGVGFRPTVWRIAHDLNVSGSVRNNGQGVVIEVWAELSIIDQLLQCLNQQLPPLAKVNTIERQLLCGTPEHLGFEIITSEASEAATAIAADATICADCLSEINDPGNRRYRYPFTNCTYCGPRFSIIKAIPYDRINTSMAAFNMCPACQTEYDNPNDRRFHAQPNACSDCGPRIWLQDNKGDHMACDDVIEQVAYLIKAGQIVAIKGIGGFHLTCDAMNEQAVAQLRQRKRRYHKPFALLARDVEMIQRFAMVNTQQIELLQSRAAPIILLPVGGEALTTDIAPGQQTLGFALPSTALHHLLMQSLQSPLVFTSGNISDNPQCIDNQDACEKLTATADVFLLHDREIINRVDDSVVKFLSGRPVMVRRARGYAPSTIMLPPGFENSPAMLAMGAELKNTFCLTQSAQAIVSQHIGDLESALILVDYRRQLELYLSFYQHRPEVVVVDKHPNYLSTQYGRQLAEDRGITCIEVQHHHAHIAAVMAENVLPLECKPVLGIALDGLGMGENGELWGGEFLLADYAQFKRLAAFEPIALLGGSQAMREPWRNTLAQLLHWFEWPQLIDEFGDLELMQYLQNKPIATLQQMAEQGINSPSCSSAGRLFDAVAAAIAICRDEVGYEGQAAMELEALAAPIHESIHCTYPVEPQWRDGQWRLAWPSMWWSVLNDLQQGVSAATIAARFHRTLSAVIVRMALKLCHQYKLQQVVLAGGVFQNRLLLEDVTQQLSKADIEILRPMQLPLNDGAIGFGQVVVAAANEICE